MTPRTVPGLVMSEDDLLVDLIGPNKNRLPLAPLFGWKTAHFRAALTKHGWRTAVSGDGKGFPDLVLIKPPRVIFAELKSDSGSLSPEQRDWKERFEECPGVECYVWRPRDLDEIVRILR